jgi:O-antigen/teichoic acid export membrane protein
MSETASQLLSHKLVRNTIFNSLGRIAGLLSAFLVTPYVVATLGPRMFGLWSLVLVLIGSLEMLDFGLRPVFMKYVAEYHLRGEQDRINHLVTSGIALYGGVGLVALVCGVLFVQPVLRLSGISADLFAVARIVVPLAIAVFCLNILYRLLEAVVWGLQRMEVSNSVAIGVAVFQAVATVIALAQGYGLVGLLVARGMATLLGVMFLSLGLWKLMPQLRIGLRYVQRAGFSVLLGYGSKIQVTKLAELAFTEGDKLFLGYFVGLPAVAFYELAARVIQGTRLLSMMVTSAVVPAASELDAGGDQALLRLLFRRASKYLVLAAAPLNLFPVALAPWIVLAWVGQGYTPVVWIIQALAVGHFAHVLTSSGTTLVRGIGVPGYETRYALLLAAVNSLLSLGLISRLGFTGVLLATPTALILSSVYFQRSIESLVGMRWQVLWQRIYGPPTLACLVVGSLVYLGCAVLFPPTQAMSRLQAIAVVLAGGAVLSLGYGLIVWYSSYLDTYDRRLLSGLVRGMHREQPLAVDITN